MAKRPAAAARGAARADDDVPLPEMDLGNDGAPMRVPDDDTPSRGVQKKLTLLLTDSDDIEIDRMQPQTRAKLVKGIKGNAAIMREIVGDGAGGASLQLDGEMVGLLYGIVGQIGVAIARGFATKETAERMQFTAEDVKLLTAPTLAVIAKYPIVTGKWKEEIILTATLGAVLYGKVQQLELLKTPGVVRDFPVAAPSPVLPEDVTQ